MMFTQWFSQRKARKQAAKALYQAAFDQSRDPAFYEVMGVADTMDGRFDLVSLHVFLLIERLEQFGPVGKKLSQSVFDAMFRSMDLMFREIGVGDLGVPKRMAKMMKAFNGRVHAYHDALHTTPAALELAVTRNIYRAEGEAIPNGVRSVVDYILRSNAHLSQYDLSDLSAGRVSFPQAVETQRRSAHG